jgi:lipopolysaccharide/colanic/teichoic acid biosynthesis glycosyltransferase
VPGSEDCGWLDPVERLLDVTIAAVGLVVLSPVLLVVGGLIRLESPGPALVRQRRLGRGRRPFWAWKFRTMAVDAERSLALARQPGAWPSGLPILRVRDDPRVTPLGRSLRWSGLDALPQLWNVLRGEISLFDPWPLPPVLGGDRPPRREPAPAPASVCT